MDMNFVFDEKGVWITGEAIEPATVFSCGQCFRFAPHGEEYVGVAHKRVLHVRKADKGLYLYPVDQQAFSQIWRHYFDLDRRYAQIESRFSGNAVLAKTLSCARGLRLLNQQPFEVLISFIISANNNMGRIRNSIEALARRVGEPVEAEYHSFPEPQALCQLSAGALRECGLGYRAPYVHDTAKRVTEGFDLQALYELPYREAKSRLMELKGVGAKVADCILLFAYNKKEAFPVDVWMKRVLKALYGFVPKNDGEVEAFAREQFGGHAGIAQQYLFCYARQNKLI